MVSSMAGLGERERDRSDSVPVRVSGMSKEVVEPLVEEERGEMMESEEAVEALETLRMRRPGSLGPAGDGARWYLELGWAFPAVVSMAKRECMVGGSKPDSR